MTDASVPDEARGASTLLEVLAEAAEAGYSDQIVVADDGGFRCTNCDTITPVASFDVEGFQRLEGASDPADMMIVVWGTCPVCNRGGVATIGYGPNATAGDEIALEALDLAGLDDAGGAPHHN